MTRLEEEEKLQVSVKRLIKIMKIKQPKAAIISHFGISDGNVCLREFDGKIQIMFRCLYSMNSLLVPGKRVYGYKSGKRRLISFCEKELKAKACSAWDHSPRGFLVVFDRKVPESFLQCIRNYRKLKCEKCKSFYVCEVLTRRMKLFKVIKDGMLKVYV